MIFHCYFCNERMLSFNYFCKKCTDLRRMFLISDQERLLNLIRSNLTLLSQNPQLKPLLPLKPQFTASLDDTLMPPNLQEDHKNI